MPRERSAAAPQREAQGGHQLLTDILRWRHDFALVAALVGPPGAGKTNLLEKVSGAARANKFYVEYVDLAEARELWEVDNFYRWLARKLRENWWREIPASGSARLGFCTMLGRALAQQSQPVLFALDHIESLPQDCAHHLISDLREIQDQAESGGAWGRLRLVVAGSVSVYELRRRVNSPNLQFRLHILPSSDSAGAEEATQEYLQNAHRRANDMVVGFLAEQTGGEPAFLLALENYLPRPRIEIADAEAAVASLLRNSSQYRHLSQPTSWYLLDRELKDKADRVLDGSPVALPAPATDIDRYQIAGVWITAGKTRTQPRFRNGLVERLIRGVRAYPGDASIDHGLMKVANLQKFALAATEIHGLLDCLGCAWRELSGLEGSPQLLVGNREIGFALDGASVLHARLPERGGNERNGQIAHTLTTRVAGEWTADTSWSGSDEAVMVRMRPDKAFSPSVAAGEMLRLWSLYLQPLEKVCLKLAHETLGRHVLRTGLNVAPKRVFVSSTYSDLVDHRRAVLEQVVRRDLLFRGMEFFGADPASPPPAEKIVREVREADTYLGIFGVRYGYVDPKSGLSMTELEFNEAESSGKPMLLYVMRDDAKVPASLFDADTEPKRKALLSRVKKHIVYQFATAEELARQVYEDLGKL